jgi:hypothetical protein
MLIGREHVDYSDNRKVPLMICTLCRAAILEE